MNDTVAELRAYYADVAPERLCAARDAMDEDAERRRRTSAWDEAGPAIAAA